MKQRFFIVECCLIGAVIAATIAYNVTRPTAALASSAVSSDSDEEMIRRGGYLVKVAGCNDCHTPNYLVAPDTVQEDDYLIGVPVGWLGPWGTTYASNLRWTVADFTEDVWVQILKTRKASPPMPWMNVNHFVESDSRAIYRYIKSLGLKGDRMPTALPPGEIPQTPYFDFNIKGLPEAAQ